MKLSVVLPLYNEEKGVSETLEGILNALGGMEDFELILVDDASTDKTPEICARFPRARLLRHPRNMGYGSALKTGIHACQGDWVLIMDGDGSYPTGAIGELLAGMEGSDMILGCRRKIPYESLGPIKHAARLGLNLLASFVAGKWIPDMNTGMRIFRRDRVLPILEELSNRFSFSTGLTLVGHLEGWGVKNHSVDYLPRKGFSKVRLFRDGLRTVWIILGCGFKRRKLWMGGWTLAVLIGVLLYMNSKC